MRPVAWSTMIGGPVSEKLPLVFVHGIRLSQACWVEQRSLAESERATLAVDLPGHGSRRGEQFSFEAAIETVIDAVDKVGGRAAVVGHSLGGYVTMLAAADAPEKLTSIVIADATLRPGPPLAAAFRATHRALTLMPAMGDQISRVVMRRTLPEHLADSVIDAGIATEVIPDVMSRTDPQRILRALNEYSGSVSFLNGELDHFRLHEQQFLNAARHGRLIVVPGAGHNLPLTHGPQFADLVRAFTD
jgi:pimeloyl-ACP methyl ester carboxylesterase